MTDLIARLTELEKQATPGDWVIRRGYVMVNPGLREVVVADVASEECDKAGPQNAELIVALHDAFPTILRALKVQQAAEASIEALQAEVTTLRTALEEVSMAVGDYVVAKERMAGRADYDEYMLMQLNRMADAAICGREVLHGSQ